MSAFLTYEGTTDFLAVTPGLVITFAASGSITAGRAVAFDTSNPGYVYQPANVPSGSVRAAGVASVTVANGDPVSVIVWGYVKSLPVLPTDRTLTIGQPLVVTGSGYWTTSGSSYTSFVAGTVVSGSAGYAFAYINCMRPVGAFAAA